jgi:tetratricopeptide (TPR) repeat protein
MTRHLVRFIAIAVVIGLGIGAFGGTAFAESKADKMFRKGKRLLKRKKYEAACQTFERVDQLDPGIGAKLNVAKCYEEWGKLAHAYDWYTAAHKMAKANKDKRAARIKDLVEALDQDVPRLTVKIPDGTDIIAAAIKLDGKELEKDQFGQELRVDPGHHTLDYISADKPQQKTVKIGRGALSEIELPIEPSKKTDQGDTTNQVDNNNGKTDNRNNNNNNNNKPIDAPPPKSNWRKLAAYAGGGVGLIGLGVAGAITLGARSSYNDALSQHCRNDTSMCDTEGLKATKDARKKANIATGVSIASGVVVVASVVLYVTAPKSHRANSEHALRIVPSVGNGQAGVVLTGGF